METNTVYAIVTLWLLTQVSINCDDELRKKFGNEFVNDLKHYHAELIQDNMKHLENLYTILLRDFKTTPTEAKKFKERLVKITEIQNEIGDTITVHILQDARSFVHEVTFELVLLSVNPSIAKNPTKQRALKEALDDTTRSDKYDLKAFHQKLYKRYHEMYQTIPKAELNANPEYTEIDGKLEHASKRNVSVAFNLPDFLENQSIYQVLGDLFDVPEYKEFF